MSRRDVRFARVLLLGVCGCVAAVTTGCKEEFSDERFGVLDLASFYDGGTRTNPAAGVPRDIIAESAYVAGAVAEFYDFGLVPAILNNSGDPVGVRVQPMYFFFDQGGAPLFSRPVRELRDGTDWMKGGKGVLDPNPKDFCLPPPGVDPAQVDQVQCALKNEEQRKKSYSLRQRDYVVDKFRGVSDYQRPLVEVVPGDDEPPRRQYTGLWEIVAVTVPDDYEPDSIKHPDTLEKALASGKFSKRATGKVINCPIVDERTAVQRGITSRGIFHPRIELWYRRQLAYCFLANGWETLGNVGAEPFFANQDELRIETFDVDRVKVGSGTELAVSVGKAYQPVTLLFDPNTGEENTIKRIKENTLFSRRPRATPTDPRGYSPMSWVFDLPVPIDFKIGSVKTEAEIDVENAIGNPVRVRNLAVRGVGIPCSFEKVAADFNRCGRAVTKPSGVVVADPTGDPVCNAQRSPGDPPLECNPDTCFCDAPFVGYGQACGPGIAQCSPTEDKFAPVGYQCFPPWGGFCQRGCDPGKPNAHAEANKGKEITDQVDSRCGEIPGLVCFAGIRTCVKFCNQNITAANQCSAMVKVGEEVRETQEGQICQDFGITICAWPDTHSPQPFPIPQ